MTTQMHGTTAIKVQSELAAIEGWYGLNGRSFLALIDEHFNDYLEITFQPDRYEIITGGQGRKCFDSFLRVGEMLGLSSKTLDRFTYLWKKFPDAFLGIKIPVDKGGQTAPTLYLRSKCPKGDILAGLQSCGLATHTVRRLSELIDANECFYGLGFTDIEGEPTLKSYTISPIEGNCSQSVGFVSHRIQGDCISPARKEYVPDMPIDQFVPPNEEWRKLVEFLHVKMGYHIAGHLGYEVDKQDVFNPKIYVERMGAIPTDFEAR